MRQRQWQKDNDRYSDNDRERERNYEETVKDPVCGSKDSECDRDTFWFQWKDREERDNDSNRGTFGFPAVVKNILQFHREKTNSWFLHNVVAYYVAQIYFHWPFWKTISWNEIGCNRQQQLFLLWNYNWKRYICHHQG